MASIMIYGIVGIIAWLAFSMIVGIAVGSYLRKYGDPIDRLKNNIYGKVERKDKR